MFAVKMCFENKLEIYRRTPWRGVISIKLQSNTLAWVFSCKFAEYFKKTFSEEHLWMVASEKT